MKLTQDSYDKNFLICHSTLVLYSVKDQSTLSSTNKNVCTTQTIVVVVYVYDITLPLRIVSSTFFLQSCESNFESFVLSIIFDW